MAIVRIWKGVTAPEHRDSYLDYLLETGLSEYRETRGNLGAFALRRSTDEGVEWMLVTLWESWEAIRRFAGDRPEVAVFYPRDEAFLVEADPRVTHFELAFQDPAPEATHIGA